MIEFSVCMIVLNESENIVKTVKPLVYFGVKRILILDTGSTDNTLISINNYFKEELLYPLNSLELLEDKNVTNPIVISKNYQNMEFRDFSVMRNYALFLSRKYYNSKYILFLDSEWMIKGLNELNNFCKANHKFDCMNNIDFHMIKVLDHTDKKHYRDFLLLNNSKAQFEGMIHEYIFGNKGINCPDEIYINWETTNLTREKSRKRWFYDIKVYEHIFSESEKNNKQITSRDLYYCARTYYFIDDYNNALRFFLRRIIHENEFHPNERYLAIIYIGKIYGIKGLINKAIEKYNYAYKYLPNRIEALIELSLCYIKKEEYQKSYNISLLTITKNFECNFISEAKNFSTDRYVNFAISAFHISTNSNYEITNKSIFNEGYINGLKVDVKLASNIFKDYMNKYFYIKSFVKQDEMEKFVNNLNINENENKYITIAILAKDKEFVLPTYLKCIELQNYPKNKIHLYIRTNNNNDKSKEILDKWVKINEKFYASVYYDSSDVEERVQNYSQHTWNEIRFKVLGFIRQLSINYAILTKSHYFVCDCDNFIIPETLINMINTNLDVVAPLLKNLVDDDFKSIMGNNYTNMHAEINSSGFYKASDYEKDIISRNIIGTLEVPVVHCTYFIRNNVLPKICYDYLDNQFEYITFSKSCRNNKIKQYIDNTYFYGYLTFAEKSEDFDRFVATKIKWTLK